jgi:hypothetical protein
MVNVIVPDVKPETQLYHICVDIPEGRYASDPLTRGEGGVSEPILKAHEIIDLDEFSSISGWGEHPCQHDHVDGDVLLNFNKLSTDQLQDANWSPRWTDSTYYFPKLMGKQVSGYWIISSVPTPWEEWVGLSLRSAAIHGAVSGSITPGHIHITVCEAWYWNGHYLPEYGAFCTTYNLIRDNDVDPPHYSGTCTRGVVDPDVLPQSLPGSPFDASVEEYELTATIVAGQTAIDGLQEAFAEITRCGLIDSIVLKATEGSSVRDILLSPTQDAIDAMEPVTVLSSNNVENAIQAADIAGAISPLRSAVDLARNVDDPSQWVRSGGQLYLWYKYVAKPTYQDVAEGIAAYRQRAQNTLTQLRSGVFRSSSSSTHLGWTCKTAARVSLHPYAADAVSKCLNVCDNIGILPTGACLWDLVPYSFVADWVVNVQACLRAIDTMMFSYRYQIDEVTSSTKATLRGWIPPGFSSDILTCSGIDFSFYSRAVSPTIPVDPTINLRGLTTTGHTLAGSALLVCNAV